MVTRKKGHLGHRESLGGNHIRFSREEKYRIPEGVIRYLCGFPDPVVVERVTRYLRAMQFSPFNEVRDQDLNDQRLTDMARALTTTEHLPQFVRSIVVAEGHMPGEEAEKRRLSLKADYADSVFNITRKSPPIVRGPFGEATIELRPGANPIKKECTRSWAPGVRPG